MLYLHHRIVRKRQRHAKTDILGSCFWQMPTTYGEMAIGDTLIITAASSDAVTSSISSTWIRLCAERIWTIDILTPFRHIAGHVVQAQLVWVLSSNWMFPIARTRIGPTNTIRLISSCKTICFALRAASCCIFPFGLGGQTKRQTCDTIQPSHKLLAIKPRNVRDRHSWIAFRINNLSLWHHRAP